MLVSRKIVSLSVALAIAALPLTSMRSEATTATATIAVSATVLGLCSVAALPVAFGNYQSGAASTGTSTITVTCTAGTTYTVGLDNGTTSGATSAARLLSNGSGDTLTYSLYKDSGYSTVWGNTIGTNTTAGTGSGL